MGDGRGMAAVSGLPQNSIADRRDYFEGARKPLRMRFPVMWFVTSQKNGVSALGLQRELGLGSYETAWNPGCTSVPPPWSGRAGTCCLVRSRLMKSMLVARNRVREAEKPRARPSSP